MRALKTFAPAFMLLVLVALVAAPWPLPMADRLLLPLLPMGLIHFRALRPRAAMPVALAFAAGLMLDALAQGPLGFWALLYVLGWAGAVASRAALQPRGGLVVGWLTFALVLLALAALALALSSAVLGEVGSPWSFVRALRLPLAGYPVIAAIGWLLTESRIPTRAARFERSR